MLLLKAWLYLCIMELVSFTLVTLCKFKQHLRDHWCTLCSKSPILTVPCHSLKHNVIFTSVLFEVISPWRLFTISFGYLLEQRYGEGISYFWTRHHHLQRKPQQHQQFLSRQRNSCFVYFKADWLIIMKKNVDCLVLLVGNGIRGRVAESINTPYLCVACGYIRTCMNENKKLTHILPNQTKSGVSVWSMLTSLARRWVGGITWQWHGSEEIWPVFCSTNRCLITTYYFLSFTSDRQNSSSSWSGYWIIALLTV